MITAAAIRQDELIFSVPSPARHHHIIGKMAKAGLPIPVGGEQGFLDDRRGFVNRAVAAEIALAEGQIKELPTPPALFSEDLW